MSNLDQSATFLELLDPTVEGFTFQTFDDNETLARGAMIESCGRAER